MADFILFGTSFIDKFIKGILSTERKIVPFNSLPVPILNVHEAGRHRIEDQQTKNIINVMAEQDKEHELESMTCIVALKPLSETSAHITTHANDIV